MFRDAREFNQKYRHMFFSTVSSVTSFDELFYNARKFNQDLDGWDTSNVDNFTNVFSCCF